ncbi:Uncharacterised protein [Raoultella ornithinolytica]|nr:Uncharacterised protein [Raoultella ornithinolytica]
MGKPGGLQACGDFRVVCIAAVQRNGGIGPQLMLLAHALSCSSFMALSQLAERFSACRFVTLRAVSLLGPAVVERAEACINRDTVLLLERGERQRWHGFSGEGGEAASPISRASAVN